MLAIQPEATRPTQRRVANSLQDFNRISQWFTLMSLPTWVTHIAIRHLIFVRHGESRHHVDKLTGGWTDTSLTPLGERQVAATAEYMSTLGLPAQIPLFSSDLKRAMESAAIVGSALGLTPTPLFDLREINNGDATGLTQSQAEAIARPEPDQPDLDWRRYQNAESYREMAQRLRKALQTVNDLGSEIAIVVGHGFSGQELIRAWLKLPIDIPIAFELGVASLSELRINRWNEPLISRLNFQLPAGVTLH